MLRYCFILTFAAAIAASTYAEAAKLSGVKPATPRTCEPASAVATGFGEKNVTGFADGNLNLAIDKVKDHLADKGAKGFSIEGRKITCTDYIDFGGSIGREHKCSASAMVCAKIK
jgi:hypothetical protein